MKKHISLLLAFVLVLMINQVHAQSVSDAKKHQEMMDIIM
jgi:hypothetical protein